MGTSNNNSVTQYQQQQQAALNQGSQNIQKSFAQFNPNFYKGVTQNYLNQEGPQLMQQYRQTGQQLNYNLADKGLTHSSVAQQESSSLQSQLAQNQLQVGNQAQSQSQNLQSQVANEEAQLYGELQTSQNPTAIGQQSTNLAAQTAAPSVFAPVGNLFSNWSNLYLANQTANTANSNNELALALYSPYLNQASQFAGGAASPGVQ